MAINKKLINCPTKTIFSTKLAAGDIPSNAIVFIGDTGELWTHNKYYGGSITGTGTQSMVINLGGVSKSFSLNTHTHVYSDLTGSTGTANQAIVSTASVNGWTLKTLGSNAFNSTSYLPLSGGTLTGLLNVKTTIRQYTSSGSNYSYIKQTDVASNVSRLTIGTCYGYDTEVDAISFFNGQTTTYGLLTASAGISTTTLAVSSTALVTNLNADLVDGYHATSFLKLNGVWGDNDATKSADTASVGIVFAYPLQGVPDYWGTLVTMANSEGSNYNLQLFGSGVNGLYFRNKSADLGQLSWLRVLDASCYTSYISSSYIQSTLGSTVYAPYNANGYLPMNGGTLSGNLGISVAGDIGANLALTNENNSGVSGKTWVIFNMGKGYGYGLQIWRYGDGNSIVNTIFGNDGSLTQCGSITSTSTGRFAGLLTANGGISTTSITAQTANLSGTYSTNYAYAYELNYGNSLKTWMYKDSDNFYLMLSNAGGTTFNDLRPFAVNLTSGKLSSGNGQYLGGGTEIQSLSVDGASGFTGESTFSSAVHLNGIPYFKANQAVYIRDGNTSWNSGIFYSSSGGECMSFIENNVSSSFMFVIGATPLESYVAETYNTATNIPSVQIKKSALYVNTFLASGSSPSYNFYVTGTGYFSGAVTLASTLAVTGATSLSSTLSVSGATTLASTLSVAGVTDISGKSGDGHSLALRNQGWLDFYNTGNSHRISINYVDSLDKLDFYDRTTDVFAGIRSGSIITFDAIYINKSSAQNRGIRFGSNDSADFVGRYNEYVSLYNINGAEIKLKDVGIIELNSATNILSTLSVTGTTTMTGKLTANGGIGTTSLTASSTLSVTGATTLASTLSVAGQTTFTEAGSDCFLNFYSSTETKTFKLGIKLPSARFGPSYFDGTNYYGLLHEGNYNSYAPTLTGTGASGTWGIDITGYSSLLVVHDNRGAERAPTYYASYRVSSFFNESVSGFNGNWASGINVAGWSTEDYYSWQLISNSTTSSTNNNLYWRTGVGSSWGATRTLVDSSNYTSYQVDTKNTVGATATTSQIYFVGVTGAATYTQSYINSSCYINASNQIYAAAFFENSDERLKNILKPLDCSLEDILEIPTFYYELKKLPGETMIGTSAQKLLNKFPELVNKDTNGYYSVSYDKIAILAIRAIKLLANRIDKLENNGNRN